MSYVIPNLEANSNSCVKFIENVTSKLQEIKDLSDLDLILKIVSKLSQMYFSMKSYREEICNAVVKNSTISTLADIIVNLNGRGYFSSDDIWFPTYYCYNTLWNYSDYNEEMAIEVSRSSLPSTVIANITHDPYISGLQSQNILYLIRASISIVHNVSRHSGLAICFKQKELKNSLVKLIRMDDTNFVGLVSMLTLACIVDEDELYLLEEGKNTTQILITRIRNMIQNSRKDTDGFEIWEFLNGLKMISVNDNMKKAIVREDGLNLFIDILRKPACDKDVDKSLGALWNLCFDQDIRSILTTVYDMIAVIKPYENHSLQSIRQSYDGIMWLVNNKKQSVERVKTATARNRSTKQQSKFEFDLFLSYSWSNKLIVFPVKEALEKAGLKIWIDVDQMKGSTLEAMASGIERSALFLMAVSESYRTSPNCRTEAEYAFSLKKQIIPIVVENRYKASGWLGIIMGSKMYFEFSERKEFGDSMRSLLSTMRSSLNNDINESIEQSIIAHSVVSAVETNPASVASSGSQSNKKSVKQWTNKDVSKWLTDSKLDHLKAKFVDYDGVLLLSLIEIGDKAPDYFYQSLKSEYGMKLVDVAKFNNSTRALM